MMRNKAIRYWAILGSFVATVGCSAQTRTQKETEIDPAPRPAADVTPAPKGQAPVIDDEVVDKILTRLETRQIDDLRAKVTWESGDSVNPSGAMRKMGEILYRQEKPVAKFKVRFTKKIVNKVLHPLSEEHLFDGETYTELNEETKSVIRREIRDPQDKSNPYKVGEGAFPVPFGQRKSDILKEFEVTRLLPTDKDPKNTDHLKLLPRKGTNSARRYKTVEFWINNADAEQSGLPVKVRTVEQAAAADEQSYLDVLFDNVQINSGIGGNPFQIDTPDGFQETFETRDGQLIDKKPGKKR